MTLPGKTPNEEKWYELDWSTNLGTDTISASSWSASDSAITLATPSFTSTTTSVLVEGGSVGNTYTITNQVTTAGGNVLEQSFPFVVREYNLINVGP